MLVDWIRTEVEQLYCTALRIIPQSYPREGTDSVYIL